MESPINTPLPEPHHSTASWLDSRRSSSTNSPESSSPTLAASLPTIHSPPFNLGNLNSTSTISRHPSSTISAIPEECSLPSVQKTRSWDTKELGEVNYHDVTVNLTDLLNCEIVRNDPEMRLWAQSRLMEAQQELRRLRRRRVSAPSVVVNPAVEPVRKAST